MPCIGCVACLPACGPLLLHCVMRYLSDAWLDAANDALATSEAPPQGARLIIDQHVSDVGSWRVVIDDAPHIDRLAGEDPERSRADAAFRQSLATAHAIAVGSTDAHQAFLLGEIRFEGDINAVIQQRDALRWLQLALAPVMAQTTWPAA